MTGLASSEKVLVVAPQPFYEDRGTPIAVRQFIEALTHLDYDVDLVTYPIGESVPLDRVRYVRAANPLRLRSVPIGFSWRKVALDLTLVLALRRCLARERYAFVHAVEEAAFPAAWFGRRRNVPVIYDMQSSLPEQLLEHALFRPKLVQALLRRAERWLLRSSSLIVSSTGLAERVRRAVPEAGVREWRFASLEPSQSDSARAGLRRSMGISADAPVVLYSGSFASYQGLAELLRAAPLVRERVPGATFVLVGAEGREGERLSTLAATMGLNDAIQIVPRQPRHLMPTYLAIADVLVSPRQHGGNLPLKIFDYLASGRPIVATDIPTHRAVLTDETAVLVQPNAAAIAAGLAEVLERPELAASLARNATEYAQANCGWLGFVDSVEELARAVTHRA